MPKIDPEARSISSASNNEPRTSPITFISSANPTIRLEAGYCPPFVGGD
jgi:hypothetical protein